MKKIMYVIFFTTKTLSILDPVPKGKSVNARFYQKKVLKKLSSRIVNQGIQGMYLLHDNTWSHTAGSVIAFLNEQ